VWFVALTKDVDLTISNFLDGRSKFDADEDSVANVITPADKLTSSLAVCLSAVSHVFSARQHAERAICYRPSVRLSVCPSVRLSHGWISQKRLNVSSKFFHHLIGPTF